MAQSLDRESRFAAMFQEHHDSIQGYFLRRLPTDDVNDAVAQVFLVAWRRLADLPDGKELPWLYGIARNVVRNVGRSSQRYARLRRRLDNTGRVHSPGPEAQVVRNHEHQAVLDALSTLSDRDQEILRLKTWEEMSTTDIAVALGITERAVDMRIRRSRKRLADAYERRHGSEIRPTQSPFRRRREVSGEHRDL